MIAAFRFRPWLQVRIATGAIAGCLTVCAAQEPPAPCAAIVVVQVAPRSDAGRAGFAAGDCISSWSQGSARGEFRTTFDLAEVQLEYGSRGAVTVHGWRGAQPRNWTIMSYAWGIKARPLMDPPLVAEYEAGLQLVNSGKQVEGAGRWRS